MARVFVAMYNFGRKSNDFEAMPPFYESFLQGLKQAGNQVLCFQHKTFKREFNEKIPRDIYERLISFNPQVCILFCNNFWNISNIVDCPIVIYDVDSPLMFANIEELRKNINRYLFVINQTNGYEPIIETFGASRSQIHYIPFFTEIKSDPEAEFINNIVFLGTNWLWRGCNFLKQFPSTLPSNKDRAMAKAVMERFCAYPFNSAKEIYYQARMHPHEVIDFGDINRAAVEISGLNRLRYLSAVADLGLEIRGTYWKIDCMSYFPELLLAYNPQETLSVQETSDFYNTAKISINTKHIQARSGFSFRVCDILASNACLVTEWSSDLHELFPKVEIPTFTTASEAREQCVRLLKDENLRREIVMASNEAIDKGFRFHHLLSRLEDIVGLSLTSTQNGSLTIFSDEKQSLQQYESPQSDNLLQKIGKHLGYDPEHYYPTKYVSVGKFRIFKIMNIKNGEKHIYCGLFPLIRIISEKDQMKIQLLAIHKGKKLINYIRCNGLIFKRKRSLWMLLKKQVHKTNLKRKYKRNEKIKFCLFASRTSDWQFDELYNILENSNIFQPFVVIKPFMSQGHDAMVKFMEDTYEFIKAKGFRVLKTYDKFSDTFLDLRKELNPDILFYTMYWPPHFHKNYYIHNFLDKITFYTSYAYDCARHDETMNFELNNLVDRYFVPTSIHKALAQKCMDNHAKNVVVVGSPKLDPFFRNDYQSHDVWKPQAHPKKRLIWAPHHSDHYPKWQYQFNAFYEICDIMFDIAQRYKDEVQFTFKPHPMLKEKLIKLWGQENTEAYYDRWASLDNGQLEEGSFHDLFLNSDAMILDSISFIAEYMAVDKPSLFTIGPKSRVYLNEFGEMCFNHIYKASGNLEMGICNFIENVIIKGNDYKASERKQFISQYLAPPKGRSSAQIIYDAICKEIFS